MHDKPITARTSSDASGLINMLKAGKGVEVDLDQTLEGVYRHEHGTV
jgi:hypothetical protein